MILLAVLFFMYSDENISKIVFLILSILSVTEFANILKADIFEKSVLMLSAVILFFVDSISVEKKIGILLFADIMIFFLIRVIRDRIETSFIEFTVIAAFLGVIPYYIMYNMFNTQKFILLQIMILVWIYDMSAYFTGVKFGKKRLVPNISPKKSWEGLIGATFCVFAFSLIYLYMEFYSLRQILLLDILIVCLAPLGDLSVSLLKRKNVIKDSGNIIPGHGGILDRMDSFIFLIPTIFYIGVF
jgi:phosphatidate cytidylyltransferase